MMANDADLVRHAVEVGRRQAGEVLAFRARALDRRAVAVERVAREVPAKPRRPDPKKVRAAGRPSRAGVLVAEGDSWFDYPWHDILRLLEDDYTYDVDSVAHKGDRVEEMAYSGGQLEEFTRHIEKLLRRNVVPKAILLSGGGNDVAGDEFGMLLNHAASPKPGLNENILTGVIDERVQAAYVTILISVTELCVAKTGRKLPILLHGYDYPVPDGRGFAGGWWFLPGPWLEPGFREKGFPAMRERLAVMHQLIDRFNGMLERVAALPEMSHVKYVNLRGTLHTGRDYKNDWANELHPTLHGFELVTAKFAEVLSQL
jgi:hypothetical protein